jgi:hypothetical protein
MQTQAGGLYQECGDIDDDSAITIADYTYIASYLWNGGPAPIFPTRDIDGRAGLTAQDIAWWYCAFVCDFDWTQCEANGPALIPEVDSSFELRYPNRLPANFASSAITLIADNPTPGTSAFSLVLRFRIGETIPIIDSINYPYSQDSLNTNEYVLTVDQDSAEIVLGMFGVPGNTVSDTLAQLFLSYPSAPTIPEADRFRSMQLSRF